MPLLKCGVKPCVFYQDHHCTRISIMVKGEEAHLETETRCESFHKRERENKNDIYKIELASLGTINEHMSVNCEAVHCLYNRNLLCYAKEIKIDGTRAKNTKDTFCSSFELIKE